MARYTLEYKADNDSFLYSPSGNGANMMIESDRFFAFGNPTNQDVRRQRDSQARRQLAEALIVPANRSSHFDSYKFLIDIADSLFAAKGKSMAETGLFRNPKIVVYAGEKRQKELTKNDFMGQRGREILNMNSVDQVEMAIDMLVQLREIERTKVDERLGHDEMRIPAEFTPPSSRRDFRAPQQPPVARPQPPVALDDDLDLPGDESYVAPPPVAAATQPATVSDAERLSFGDTYRKSQLVRKSQVTDSLTDIQKQDPLFSGIVLADSQSAIEELLKEFIADDLRQQEKGDKMAEFAAKRLVTPGYSDRDQRATEPLDNENLLSPNARAKLITTAELLWDHAGVTRQRSFTIPTASGGISAARINDKSELRDVSDYKLVQYVRFRGNVARDLIDQSRTSGDGQPRP
ncbi:MAG: hypothetical protein SFT92_00175 [Rickettsiales bacterium]|nr:hypothetical protein [Rickettsiales bacterium]